LGLRHVAATKQREQFLVGCIVAAVAHLLKKLERLLPLRFDKCPDAV
jgi:hypothetical protein